MQLGVEGLVALVHRQRLAPRLDGPLVVVGLERLVPGLFRALHQLELLDQRAVLRVIWILSRGLLQKAEKGDRKERAAGGR